MYLTRALALPVWLVLFAGCGDGGAPEDLGTSSSGGATADAGDGNESDASDGANDAGEGGGDGGNGTSSTTGSGTDAGSDGSASDAGDSSVDAGPIRDPSTILGISKPKVQCGDEQCEGVTQVCCDKWTTEGWAEPTCMEKEECSTFAFAWATENNVKSECDGPEDCATGAPDDPVVCCFLLQSPPHYEGLTRKPGPGYGRECVRKSACLADGIEDAEPTEGMPRGILSCNADADCDVADGDLECEPESAEDESAGDLEPRSHVSLCK